MQCWHTLIVKWYLATDQDVQHNPKTPNIDFRSCVRLCLQQLWRCKVQTPAKRLQMAGRSKQVTQAKINDLNIARLTYQDVLDLEVSVNDAVSMAIVQGARNLSAEFPSLFLLQPSVRDNIVKHLSPIDIFKKHIPMVGRAHHISHGTYVWVIQKSDNGGFTCRSDFLRMVGSFSICSTLIMSIISRPSRHNLDCDLMIIVSLDGKNRLRLGDKYLFASFDLPSQLHFAHTSCANRLPKNPIPCLRWYCSS